MPAWDLYDWVLGPTEQATAIDSIPSRSGNVGTFRFDGTPFLAEAAPDFSATVFFDLTQRPFQPHGGLGLLPL